MMKKIRVRVWDCLMLSIFIVVGLSWMWMVLNGIYLDDLVDF